MANDDYREPQQAAREHGLAKRQAVRQERAIRRETANEIADMTLSAHHADCAEEGRQPAEQLFANTAKGEDGSCINPEHLRLLTISENARLRRETLKTHCKRGHEFTPENTYNPLRWPNRRVCRACRADRERSYREKRKEGS